MTEPFRIPPPYQRAGARPACADLTLHLGDGKTMKMRIDYPAVTVEHRNRYDDYLSFGSPLRSYASPREVTITLDGVLGDPNRDVEPPAKPKASPAPAPASPWSELAGDPVADVRTWARRMREDATAAPPVRDVNDVPTLADLGDDR